MAADGAAGPFAAAGSSAEAAPALAKVSEQAPPAAAAEPEDAEPDRDAGDAAEVTGEEDEEVLFKGECKLWKLVKDQAVQPAADEDQPWRWQERGCGFVHINRHRASGAGRIVMRMRGVLKLLLNTPVFPTTRYEKMGQKTVRFVGIDAEEPSQDKVPLSAFRISLQSADQQDKFLTVLRDMVGCNDA